MVDAQLRQRFESTYATHTLSSASSTYKCDSVAREGCFPLGGGVGKRCQEVDIGTKVAVSGQYVHRLHNLERSVTVTSFTSETTARPLESPLLNAQPEEDCIPYSRLPGCLTACRRAGRLSMM